jgi:GDPmannose 4,6-dehydratase
MGTGFDKRSAIITGICGMDGSHLAEFLLEKDYKVYGLKRRTSNNSLECAAHLENDIEIVEGDLLDLPSLLSLTKLVRADEFYNLASQSHVGTSFTQPLYTAQCTGLGVLNCLEAIRESGIHTRFYQASTSELFGGQSGETFCNEETPFHPRSPYGVAKLYGYWITVNYREAYKLFACNGLLFNHESPRRGPNFVTRKITLGAAKIKKGLQEKLYLGNLKAKRDWGHAKDFVRGMWMMLNHNQPDDYVLATGKTHTVEEFCYLAFEYLNLNWRDYVEVDPQFYRPAEVDILLGDYSKAKDILGWQPEISFEDLVKEMVSHDLDALS